MSLKVEQYEKKLLNDWSIIVIITWLKEVNIGWLMRFET